MIELYIQNSEMIHYSAFVLLPVLDSQRRSSECCIYNLRDVRYDIYVFQVVNKSKVKCSCYNLVNVKSVIYTMKMKYRFPMSSLYDYQPSRYFALLELFFFPFSSKTLNRFLKLKNRLTDISCESLVF